ETITHTRSAPASRAARTGQATIGRPHTWWRTLGTEERMRVPSPAAMMRTVGPLTRGIVERPGPREARAPWSAGGDRVAPVTDGLDPSRGRRRSCPESGGSA